MAVLLDIFLFSSISFIAPFLDVFFHSVLPTSFWSSISFLKCLENIPSPSFPSHILHLSYDKIKVSHLTLTSSYSNLIFQFKYFRSYKSFVIKFVILLYEMCVITVKLLLIHRCWKFCNYGNKPLYHS